MLSSDQANETLVECTQCGRKYRAVTKGAPPSIDDLDCHCGASRFTELLTSSLVPTSN